jgi:hypothetical protein
MVGRGGGYGALRFQGLGRRTPCAGSAVILTAVQSLRLASSERFPPPPPEAVSGCCVRPVADATD